MRKSIYMAMVLSLLLMVGCAPARFNPKESVPLTFEKTAQYKLDLKLIPAPPKMKFVFMDKNFKEVKNKDDATYMVLVKKEYRKLAATAKTINALIKLAKEQGVLINADINVINSLKEFIALEHAKATEYRNLWIDSENAYRQEAYLHRLDNAINKSTSAVIGIAALIAILAL